ncbi:MAG TPA: DUF72 domain-containing protein [Nitrososphaerales archaeon]|nr:DUF72 domain-containing protein [Nitrososphaerales archaeon]
MGEVRLGTSGWSYKEWEGPFYPKGEKKKLTYYSKFFDTVEIDSTFYGYPSKGMILGATKSTPPGFIFSAKLPKLLTHEKKLDLERGVKEDLFRFLHLMKPLIEEGKLGPLLIQLPPSFGYSDGLRKLGGFLDVLPADVSFSVEFRNKSWLGMADALDMLRGHNVAVTTVDEPLLPPDTTTTADFAFVRWHGRGGRPWYNYRYRQDELQGWSKKVEAIATKTKKVYGYFNNHFHGFAVENSLKMMDLLGSASAEQRKLLAQVSNRIDSGFKKEQLTLL